MFGSCPGPPVGLTLGMRSSSGGRGVYECLCDADVRALEPMFASRAMLIQKKIIGAVLNRADPKMLRRIEAYKGAHYNSYYVENA